MNNFKKRWLLLSEDFTNDQRDAVVTFAEILCQVIAASNPARFYSSRGDLVYAKYDIDLEKEIFNLLEKDENEEKKNDPRISNSISPPAFKRR